jgi:hypothetical protein
MLPIQINSSRLYPLLSTAIPFSLSPSHPLPSSPAFLPSLLPPLPFLPSYCGGSVRAEGAVSGARRRASVTEPTSDDNDDYCATTTTTAGHVAAPLHDPSSPRSGGGSAGRAGGGGGSAGRSGGSSARLGDKGRRRRGGRWRRLGEERRAGGSCSATRDGADDEVQRHIPSLVWSSPPSLPLPLRSARRRDGWRPVAVVAWPSPLEQ